RAGGWDRLPVHVDVDVGGYLDRYLPQRVGAVATALVGEIDVLVEDADPGAVRAGEAGGELQAVRVEREHRRVGAGLVEPDQDEQVALAGGEVRELHELRSEE